MLLKINEIITQLLLVYKLPLIFFGSFFLVETVIITFAFLSGQGMWSLFDVFWLSFIGIVLSDSIWFLFGQSIMKKTEQWPKYKEKYQSLLVKLEKMTRERPFLSLLFIKFLYGTRILTILFLFLCLAVNKQSQKNYGRNYPHTISTDFALKLDLIFMLSITEKVLRIKS